MFPTLRDPADHARLLERLAALRPDAPRAWGRMTTHGMLCHLSDSFLIGLGERPTGPASLPWHLRLPPVVLRPVMLYGPRWPQGIPTRPEADQERAGTPPAAFDADRADLVSLMQRVATPAPGTRWAPHPMGGAMTAAQWARWGWRHVNHHLRQFGV